jgi:meckelin
MLPDLNYKIVKRNFIENVLDIELQDPIPTAIFYADEDNSFQKALFYGQEKRLFTFDLALFLVIDFFAKNYILAAFVVYIIIKVSVFFSTKVINKISMIHLT